MKGVSRTKKFFLKKHGGNLRFNSFGIGSRRLENFFGMGKVATLENRAEGAKIFETLETPP